MASGYSHQLDSRHVDQGYCRAQSRRRRAAGNPVPTLFEGVRHAHGGLHTPILPRGGHTSAPVHGSPDVAPSHQTRAMSSPHSILAISGSLRSKSSNTGLVRMAQRLAPDGVTFQFWDRLGDLPFYNEDLETDPPTVVREWRDVVSGANAVFIAAPEYNFGPTGVLKNAIDWATRPLGQHALRGKTISIVSSAGSTGGAHMIEQLSGILTLLGNTVVNEPAVQIVKGAERISADGTTTDPEIEGLIGQRLAALTTKI